MKLSVALLALSVSFSSFAATHQLLQVTNDKDAKVVSVALESDANGDFISLRQIITENNAVISNVNLSEAKCRKGVALYTEGNFEVIKLKILDRFEPKYGGPFKLDYLVNGVTGSRSAIELEADREGNKWVIKLKGAIVKKGHVISNKVMGKVIGVSRIKF